MCYFGIENLEQIDYQPMSATKLKHSFSKRFSSCQRIKCSHSEICVTFIMILLYFNKTTISLPRLLENKF